MKRMAARLPGDYFVSDAQGDIQLQFTLKSLTDVRMWHLRMTRKTHELKHASEDSGLQLIIPAYAATE